MSSLTIQNPIIRIGKFQITQKGPTRFSVEGDGRQFTLWQRRPGKWAARKRSSNSCEKKPWFEAEDLTSAVEEAVFLLYDVPRPETVADLSIAQVLHRWEAVRTCSAETLAEYRASTSLFSRWCDREGLILWRDLRMEHLQKYVNDLRAKPIFSADEKRVEGYSFNYTKRILAPLKSAATWGAENFPGVFFDIGRGVKVPQDRNRNLTNARPAFTFSEVADFIFWLSGQENGWRILPGVALQGLAGLRVTEAHRLTWDRLDFAEGTLAIEGRTKNAPSVRLIPLPAFLLDILGEARERNRMRSEDSAWSESQRWNLLNRVVVSQEWKRGFSDYGREVGRYLRKWQSGCLIEPKGLRRTIFAEADRLGFLGQTLERYVGHSIKGISAVTFAHYLPLDLTAQVALMRERIVVHADAALSDHRERWNARAGSNVIPFQAASGGS